MHATRLCTTDLSAKFKEKLWVCWQEKSVKSILSSVRGGNMKEVDWEQKLHAGTLD